MFVESLKIVKKNWNPKSRVPGWQIIINDGDGHNLIDRVKDRTNLSTNEAKEKIQKAVDYVSKKIENGWFDKGKNAGNTRMMAINFEKSKFKMLVLVDPRQKVIRISTILSDDMTTRRTINWDLKEFLQEFPELEKEAKYQNESDFAPIADYSFMIEYDEKYNENRVFELHLEEIKLNL
jgi:hypothetical protein